MQNLNTHSNKLSGNQKKIKQEKYTNKGPQNNVKKNTH